VIGGVEHRQELISFSRGRFEGMKYSIADIQVAGESHGTEAEVETDVRGSLVGRKGHIEGVTVEGKHCCVC